jgi:hypothetical protein
MFRQSKWRRGLAFLLVAALCAVVVAAAAAQALAPPRVVLRDDAAGEPEFARFKARLLAAAEAGDTVTLMASMSRDISSGYEPSTPEAFALAHRVQVHAMDAGRRVRNIENHLHHVPVAAVRHFVEVSGAGEAVRARDVRMRFAE